MKYDHCIDLRDEPPPLPMIKVAEMIRVLDPGAILKVITKNMYSFRNIKVMIQQKNDFQVLHIEEVSEEQYIFIKKLL